MDPALARKILQLEVQQIEQILHALKHEDRYAFEKLEELVNEFH